MKRERFAARFHHVCRAMEAPVTIPRASRRSPVRYRWCVSVGWRRWAVGPARTPSVSGGCWRDLVVGDVGHARMRYKAPARGGGSVVARRVGGAGPRSGLGQRASASRHLETAFRAAQLAEGSLQSPAERTHQRLRRLRGTRRDPQTAGGLPSTPRRDVAPSRTSRCCSTAVFPRCDRMSTVTGCPRDISAALLTVPSTRSRLLSPGNATPGGTGLPRDRAGRCSRDQAEGLSLRTWRSS